MDLNHDRIFVMAAQRSWKNEVYSKEYSFYWQDSASFKIDLLSIDARGNYVAQRELVMPTINNNFSSTYISIVNPDDSLEIQFASPGDFMDFMTARGYEVSAQSDENKMKRAYTFSRRN